MEPLVSALNGEFTPEHIYCLELTPAAQPPSGMTITCMFNTILKYPSDCRSLHVIQKVMKLDCFRVCSAWSEASVHCSGQGWKLHGYLNTGESRRGSKESRSTWRFLLACIMDLFGIIDLGKVSGDQGFPTCSPQEASCEWVRTLTCHWTVLVSSRPVSLIITV